MDLLGGVMPEILHVDLEGFFIAVERLHAPTLRGRPVIIGGQPTAWGRVVAASVEAAGRGVRPGLSLAVAQSKCPEAVFLDGSIERYLDASAAVDEILREPMAPVEWTAIDSVFLDLTGLAARLGPSRAVAERLQDTIRRELGFDVACGLAGTMTAARVASCLSRPRGLLYVLPGYEARLLASMDVGLLPDLPPGARQRLLEHGITTLGELAALDPEVSKTVLGSRGPVLRERARGVDPRAVDGAQPPRSLAREVTLAQPITEEGRLTSVLQHVSDTLGTRLRQMGWFAHTVTVRLGLDESGDAGGLGRSSDGPSTVAEARRRETHMGRESIVLSRSVTLREATAAPDALFAAARALFRVSWRRRSVARLGIVLSNLQRVGPQIPLFPLSDRTATAVSSTPDLRTRQGLRALVEGRYLDHQRLRRRAG